MNSIPNNGENDKSLNGELDKLSSAYTRLEQDEPPELLDQAILNRAHLAVEKKPHWMKFSWLQGLTTTAVFVLAFSLILNQPESPQVLDDGSSNNEAIRLESAKVVKKQAQDVKSSERKSDDFSLEMTIKDEGRQDLPQGTPAAAAPVRALRVNSPEDQAGQMAPEVQQSLSAQEGIREKRESLDRDAEISVDLQEEIALDEADLAVDSQKIEAAYEMSRPRSVEEPVLGEAENQLKEKSVIEQELLTIIELKQAGDSQWKSELALFRERYPDYPLPDTLRD